MISEYTLQDLRDFRLDQESVLSDSLSPSERADLQAQVTTLISDVAKTKVFSLSASFLGLNKKPSLKVNLHVLDNRVVVLNKETMTSVTIDASTAQGATTQEIEEFNRLTQKIVDIGQKIWGMHTNTANNEEEPILPPQTPATRVILTPISERPLPPQPPLLLLEDAPKLPPSPASEPRILTTPSSNDSSDSTPLAFAAAAAGIGLFSSSTTPAQETKSTTSSQQADRTTVPQPTRVHEPKILPNTPLHRGLPPICSLFDSNDHLLRPQAQKRFIDEVRTFFEQDKQQQQSLPQPAGSAEAIDHMYVTDQQFLAGWQRVAPLFEQIPTLTTGTTFTPHDFSGLQNIARFLEQYYEAVTHRYLHIHIHPTAGNLPHPTKKSNTQTLLHAASASPLQAPTGNTLPSSIIHSTLPMPQENAQCPFFPETNDDETTPSFFIPANTTGEHQFLESSLLPMNGTTTPLQTQQNTGFFGLGAFLGVGALWLISRCLRRGSIRPSTAKRRGQQQRSLHGVRKRRSSLPTGIASRELLNHREISRLERILRSRQQQDGSQ